MTLCDPRWSLLRGPESYKPCISRRALHDLTLNHADSNLARVVWMPEVKGSWGSNPASPTTRWLWDVSSHRKTHNDRTICRGLLAIWRRGSRNDDHALTGTVRLKLTRRHVFRNWQWLCCAFRTVSRPCVSRITTPKMIIVCGQSRLCNRTGHPYAPVKPLVRV